MDNWMEKYERKNDEKRERELNLRLGKLLNLLDEAYRVNDRIKLLKEIIEVYDELRIEAFDYDEKDFSDRKIELSKIRYKLMEKNHKEDKDSQSWNDYRVEELEEEGFER